MATNTTINGRDYFRIRRTIDGEVKSFYGRSERDANNKYKRYLEERAGLVPAKRKDSVTFHDRAKEYIGNVLMVTDRYSTGTKKRYESSYRCHVNGSRIDQMKMADVTASDVQRFYNDLDVTSSTMKGIHKFMSAFYKWASRMGYADDVLHAVEVPKKEDSKRHDGIVVWEEEEIRDILRSIDARQTACAPFRLAFFVYVSLYVGTRISEALCLRYSDFAGGFVNIERQRYMGEIKPPKYGSKRNVPIHPDLSDAFLVHRAWHEKEMGKNGYKTEYVFTTSTGNLYDPHNVRTALRRFYEANGIPCKNVHAYRGTFCTQLCRCGVPLEVASALLGHKSVEVTAAYYALVKQDTKQDAIAKLNYHVVK